MCGNSTSARSPSTKNWATSQRDVRVVPGTVRVIRPRRMGNTADERQSVEIAIVDSIAGGMRVRCTRTDLNVRSEGHARVDAEGTPELRVVVGNAVGITKSAGAEVGPRVIPDDREFPGGRIQRDLWHELTIGCVVVVHADAAAPGGAVVVGVAHIDIRVVALVLLLLGVDQIHAAVVRAAGSIPGQACF